MSGLSSQNLVHRVLTAAVVLPVVIVTIVFYPVRGSWILAALLCVLGMVEARALLRGASLQASPAAFLPGVALFLELAGVPFLNPSFPISGLPILAAVFAALVAVGRADRQGIPMLAAEGAAALSGLLIGLGAGSFAALASLPPIDEGTARIALLLAVVIASDVFAYFVGRSLGRHKLAPQVSPGKTIEGAMGGLIGAVIASAVVATRLFNNRSLGLMIGVGVLVAIAGIVGDLLESAFKRYVGAKDSGTLFPGHGGALDRIDAFILAAPLLYVFFRSMP